MTVSLPLNPTTLNELSQTLREANQTGCSIIPVGSGTHQHMGYPPDSQSVLLSSLKLNRLIEHSEKDLNISIECGMTLGALQEMLAASGQFFPYWAPGAEQRTLGGILATGSANFFSYRYGNLRDLVLGLTVCQANGFFAKSGGKVVKNVSGYEMPKLFIGSFGTLAYLAQATLRLFPKPQNILVLRGKILNPEAGFAGLKELFCSPFNFTAASLCCKKSENNLLVRVEGKPQLTIDQATKIQAKLSVLGIDLCETTTQEEARILSSDTTTADADSIVCSGFTPPATLIQFYDALQKVNAQGESYLVFSVQGGFRATWYGCFNLEIQEKFKAINRVVSSLGGWLVYESVPEKLWRDWPMWGEERNEWDMSLRLKMLFDPNGTFNRERYLRRV